MGTTTPFLATPWARAPSLPDEAGSREGTPVLWRILEVLVDPMQAMDFLMDFMMGLLVDVRENPKQKWMMTGGSPMTKRKAPKSWVYMDL